MHIPFSAFQRQGKSLNGGKPTKVVIHSTSNTAPAINERNNLARKGNTRVASFHDVVDDKEVIECIPHNEIAFHAGRCNRYSVGIEICEGGNRSVTIVNAVKHTANVLKRHGLGVNDMMRHYDCTGKNCPRIMSANNWKEWHMFKSLVLLELKGGAKGMNEEQVRQIIREEITPSINGGSPDAHWAFKAYMYLKSKGIDINERRFDDVITRGEAITLLARAEGFEG